MQSPSRLITVDVDYARNTRSAAGHTGPVTANPSHLNRLLTLRLVGIDEWPHRHPLTSLMEVARVSRFPLRHIFFVLTGSVPTPY